MSRQIVAALILKLKDELSRDLPKANSALRKHVDELKRLDQASKALGKYDKARANLARMRTEVDKTRERIREIRTAMKTADDATLGKLRGELGQAQAKANKAANAMVGDMKRVQTAIRELNAVGIKPKDIPRAADALADRRRAIGADIDETDRANRRAGQVRNAGSALRGQGAVGMGYSVGGGYMAGRAIGSEYDFQYEANETRAKLYGAEDPESSKAKFKSLKDLAVQTAETRPWTSAEVMAGARYLAGTGLNQAQVEGALGPTVDLATAGGRELGIDRTADISTNILMAMKMPMKTTEEVLGSLGRINDVLAFTAAKSNTDVLQLGEAFKYAAPLAGQMGMSVEELSGYFAVMSNNGIKASEAGVALRSALVRMIKPVMPMVVEMNRLGINLDDFVTRSEALSGEGVVRSLQGSGFQARGMEGAIQGMIDDTNLGGADLTNAIADLIQERLGSDSLVDREALTEAIVTALASGVTNLDLSGFLEEIYKKSGGNPGGSAPYIFDARQGARLTTVMTAPEDGPRAFARRIEGESTGTAAGMSEIMMDGIVGDLKRLESALDSFIRKFFESGAADVVSDLAQAGQQLLVTLKSIDPKLLEWGAKIFTLSLLMGPLIYAMGGILSIAGSVMLLKGLAGKGGLAGALAGAAGAGMAGGKGGAAAAATAGAAGKAGGIGAGRSIASAISLWGAFDAFSDLGSRTEQYRAEGLSQQDATMKALRENWDSSERVNSWLEGALGTPRSWLGMDDGERPAEASTTREAPMRSPRAIEDASLDALRSDPNGVQDAIDEAASARAERTARTQAQVDELLARSLASAVNQVAGGKQSRFGSTAATSPSPQSATANSRIDSAFAATAGGEANAMLDGVVAAIERQSARTQPVQITAPVTTQPSGVQEVRVTNPPPPVLAPVNVTVNVTSNASPSAIGAAAGAAVSQAQRNTYSDE